MSLAQLKERVFGRSGTPEAVEQRERAAKLASEPVGPLSGAPLTEDERRRVRALIDGINQDNTPAYEKQSVVTGKAFVAAYQEAQRTLDRQPAAATPLDAGLQAAAAETKAHYQVKHVELVQLSAEDKAKVAALIEKSTQEPNKGREGAESELQASIAARLKTTDWSKDNSQHDPAMYDDLEKLARSNPSKAAQTWQESAPKDVEPPAFADPRFHAQIQGLRQVTDAINNSNEVEAVRVREGRNQAIHNGAMNDLGAKTSAVVPKDIEASYVRVGESKYHYQGKPELQAFEDKGNRLETHSNSAKVSEDLVKVAEARGWEELRVKGSEAFRQKVWLEASVRGITVQGYKPSEVDKAMLEKARSERESNQIEQVVRERQASAIRSKDQGEMTKAHPELVGVAGVLRAAELIAERDLKDRGQRDKFMAMTREALASHVEQGGKLPQTHIQQRVSQRDADQERDR